MSLIEQLAERGTKEHEPVPESFTFGDGIKWDSALLPTQLYVELPFWLMVPHGDVHLQCFGADFTVTILRPWREVFAREFTDSRKTCIHYGPAARARFEPQGEFATLLHEENAPVMERSCKTVLRIDAVGHEDAFTDEGPDEPPRAEVENRAYWASLCEAHIPVINEIIQRYRLTTYDYFAFEVSAWDVPIWYLTQSGCGYRAVLLQYCEWDWKPVIVEESPNAGNPPSVREFEWAKPANLESISVADAGPVSLNCSMRDRLWSEGTIPTQSGERPQRLRRSSVRSYRKSYLKTTTRQKRQRGSKRVRTTFPDALGNGAS